MCIQTDQTVEMKALLNEMSIPYSVIDVAVFIGKIRNNICESTDCQLEKGMRDMGIHIFRQVSLSICMLRY